MKKNYLFLLLAILINANVSGHDIEVKNADGVTIYYNYINDGKELEVTYHDFDWEVEYSGRVIIPFKVTYGDSQYDVTRIGDEAFYRDHGLTSVNIPNSVTTIGENAFWDCSGLSEIMIPRSVSFIGNNAFGSCNELTSIVVENGNTVYNSPDNSNAIIETATNTLIVGCTKTSIPNGVTNIGDGAFEYCSGLTSVTIPNGVTSIGENAFSDCWNLQSVTIPNSVTSISSGAFSNCI